VFFPNGQRILFKRLHPTEGHDVLTFEDSDLDGNDRRVLFSVKTLSECVLVLTDGRVIYDQAELRIGGSAIHESNLWEATVHLRTGELKSGPHRITNWVGVDVVSLSA